MSTRGSCSTVSQSQLVRGPSVRAHSTTVSHRAARYSAGGPERDVWRGAEGRIAVARVLEVSAGGRVPPCASRGRGRGRRPLKGVVDGSASIQYVKCHRQEPRILDDGRSTGDLERVVHPAPPPRARGGELEPATPSARPRPAPLPRAPATRGPSRCRSDVLNIVYTHTRRRSFLSCVLNMSTQHSSSSRAQRVIAQLSQGRQSRI